MRTLAWDGGPGAKPAIGVSRRETSVGPSREAGMAKIRSIEIRCLRCGEWFCSQIQFDSTESFRAGVLFGALARCRHCRHMTSCNEQNFRLLGVDGNYLSTDLVLPAVSQH
jgi:hypothetical protein